jgi:hypothetical protein
MAAVPEGDAFGKLCRPCGLLDAVFSSRERTDRIFDPPDGFWLVNRPSDAQIVDARVDVATEWVVN